MLDALPVQLTFGEAIDVRINLAGRSPVICISPVQRSVHWQLDNCYQDQAVTNARQLTDLLSSADVPVVTAGG